ncbi:NYN domain-containing protein [Candidatus Puniceispirillum sp.]|nr:NYN domain-containing protein [Candidatus Puniceispirillum sp.]
MENFRHNWLVLENAIKQLKKHSLNVNYYIDGNHLKLFLDSMIFSANKGHQEVYQFNGLGKCPSLDPNKSVYSELIFKIHSQFLTKIKREMCHEFQTVYGTNLVDEWDLFLSIKPTQRLNNPTELFESERSQKFGWDKNSPEFLEMSPYFNFFVGGGVDFQFLIKTLKKYWRDEADPNARSRIERFVEDFESRDTGARPKTNEFLNQQKFSWFREALDEFDANWKSLVAEVSEGQTRFNIKPKQHFFIEFQEKAVDTKLVMKCMDDLAKAKNDDVFVFITNDTDFLPLFERVAETHQLIWLTGAKNKSKGLSGAVGRGKIFDLVDFLSGEGLHKKIPSTKYWDNEVLKQSCPDIQVLRDDYLEQMAYEAFQKQQQEIYEDWERTARLEWENDKF